MISAEMLNTDINTHLLPEVGDGVSTLDESVELAWDLHRHGVTTIVVTPDQRDVAARIGVERALHLIGRLRRNINRHEDARFRNLSLRFGMEHLVEPNLPSLVAKGDARPIQNTRFLIVKLPFGHIPDYVDDVLEQLTLINVQPIIAHPERNEVLQRNWRQLRAWVKRFSFVQLAAGSLLGDHGRAAQSAAERFVRQGLVHTVASEASSRGQRPGRMMTAANDRIAAIVGERRANVIMHDNSRSVHQGATPRHMEDASPRRRLPRFGFSGR